MTHRAAVLTIALLVRCTLDDATDTDEVTDNDEVMVFVYLGSGGQYQARCCRRPSRGHGGYRWSPR